MRRLHCPCGHTINLSVVDVPEQHAFLPTSSWDRVVSALADVAASAPGLDRALVGERLSDALAVLVEYFYRCAHCDRLLFVSHDSQVRSYARERA